jgi:hypothetical protein
MGPRSVISCLGIHDHCDDSTEGNTTLKLKSQRLLSIWDHDASKLLSTRWTLP